VAGCAVYEPVRRGIEVFLRNEQGYRVPFPIDLGKIGAAVAKETVFLVEGLGLGWD
jgi:hypothetical protein